jgi:hypothetical protein
VLGTTTDPEIDENYRFKIGENLSSNIVCCDIKLRLDVNNISKSVFNTAFPPHPQNDSKNTLLRTPKISLRKSLIISVQFTPPKLKILVSVVQFRPRAPLRQRKLLILIGNVEV